MIDNLKDDMNKFCCFITGGHKYDDTHLTCMSDFRTQEFVLENYCVKCHKVIEIRIPERLILHEIWKPKESEDNK